MTKQVTKGRDVRSILPGSGSVGVDWNETSALSSLCVKQVSQTSAKGATGESEDLLSWFASTFGQLRTPPTSLLMRSW